MRLSEKKAKPAPQRVQTKEVESSVESHEEKPKSSAFSNMLNYWSKPQVEKPQSESSSESEEEAPAVPIKNRVARSFEAFGSKTGVNATQVPPGPPAQCTADNVPPDCVWYTDALPLGLGVGLGVGIPALALGTLICF